MSPVHLYLSSYRVGDHPEELVELASGGTIGVVPNALDHHADSEAREARVLKGLREVGDLGLDVALLDLREYFHWKDHLRDRVAGLKGVWVLGGNTFVLRQAMRLSGFDEVLLGESRHDFLYGGYSAGVCVLAPSLDGVQHVDDPTARPYAESDVVWEGLGMLEYLVLPHYKSDHPESAGIDEEVAYCEGQGIPHRTLRDGEVIILRSFTPGDSA